MLAEQLVRDVLMCYQVPQRMDVMSLMVVRMDSGYHFLMGTPANKAILTISDHPASGLQHRRDVVSYVE